MKGSPDGAREPMSHPLAAAAADGQALEERDALARRTRAAVGAIGLRVLVQPLEVPLVLAPADVSSVRTLDEGVPLLAR